MYREIISTDEAPAAIGPYSQAIRVGQFVFTAGQIAIDPSTGQMAGGDIEEQTRQVLKNISAVLQAAGTSLDQVVKTTVFLVDLGDFAVMNRVYAEYFPLEPPGRTTVQVVALPRGAKVEIEAIAFVP